IAQLRLPQNDRVRRLDAAELHQHATEALGIRHGVLQLRAIGAAGVRADDQRVALERAGAPGRRREQRGGGNRGARDTCRSHGLPSFGSEKVACWSSGGSASVPRGGARRAAATTGSTSNGVSPVTK